MSLYDRLQALDSGIDPRRIRPDPRAGLKQRLHRQLLADLGPQLTDPGLPEDRVANLVADRLPGLIAREATPLTAGERDRLAGDVTDEILGHGPLEPYLRDASVTEIMVNGPGLVYIERGGLLSPAAVTFADETHLRRVIDKIVARVGRRIDESSPMVDARLPDGSRVNAVVPPVAVDGSLLTIRKFPARPLGEDDLIAAGTVTPDLLRLLRACVAARQNMVISGGTGSGKTTTLNVLSGFAGATERIVTIEDAAELQLRQSHVLRMEARPANLEGRGQITVRDLVRNALRMRPDRIIVGEVRGGEAMDMLQAMNTGHDGSITTVHANSPADSLARIETMAMMAGLDLPQRAVREQIASAIQLIVHQARMRDGSRKVLGVTEVLGVTGTGITLRDVFVFDYQAGLLRPAAAAAALLARLAARGYGAPG